MEQAEHLGLTEATAIPPDRLPGAAWGIAAAFVALELALSDRYGFGMDELYFIEPGRHLAFGYVDQPPLAPLLTRTTGILGLSPTAIRILPALAGGFTIAATARLAALFRAGRSGQVPAALIAACAPFSLLLAHVADTTAYDVLAWTLVMLCVSTALLRDRPAWWLGAGVAAGVGMQDENLVAMLAICLTIGIGFSRYRDVLRTRWPWLGAGIAAAIWTPNAIWQASHGWPQLAMASALHQEFNSSADYIRGPFDQLFQPGLFVAPIVIVGFIGLWRDARLRFCAITVTLVLLWVLFWIPGKEYYTAGVLPTVVACGSASADRWVHTAASASAPGAAGSWRLRWCSCSSRGWRRCPSSRPAR